MPRGVQRHYREAQPPARCSIANLLYTHHGGTCANAESNETEQLGASLIVQRQDSPPEVASPRRTVSAPS